MCGVGWVGEGLLVLNGERKWGDAHLLALFDENRSKIERSRKDLTMQ